MAYKELVDTFLFAKYDSISDSDCQKIIELMDSPTQDYNNLGFKKALVNIYYSRDIEKNSIAKHPFNEDDIKGCESLYAKIKKSIKDVEKNEREIIRMDKTPEEACLWVANFIAKKKYGTALKIREQIPLAKHYNRALFISDFTLRIFELAQCPEDNVIEHVQMLSASYESILSSDPFVKFVDNDVQKIREIIILTFNHARHIFVSEYFRPNKVTKALDEHMISYYNFTHRNEKDDALLRSNINMFRGSEEEYLTRLKKKLHNDRARTNFSDLFYLTYKKNKAAGDYAECLDMLKQNVDIAVGLIRTKNGCVVLYNFIYGTKNIVFNFAEKLLVQRVLRLTSGAIVDALLETKFVIKYFNPEMKTEECPLCLEKNEYGQNPTIILECKTCKNIFCMKCISMSFKNNIKICPLCRTPFEKFGCLPNTVMLRDFKYDLIKET